MSQDYLVEVLYQIGCRLASYGNKIGNDTGLSFSQAFLLYEMLEWSAETDGSLSISSIAKKTGFSKSSVCNTVQALKRTGYLTKNINNIDNRRKEIVLTDKALSSHPQIIEQIQKVDKQLFGGIPQQERNALKGILFQLAENMQLQPARAP